MNHSGWPHAKQHWKSKAANSKEIDHQIDPKGLRQSHMSEDAHRGNQQGNRATEQQGNGATGHARLPGWGLVPQLPVTPPSAGQAWPGLVWLGLARPPGLALPGLARPGLAWPGLARQGLAWRGLAWPG